jgi:hypothetical protein
VICPGPAVVIRITRRSVPVDMPERDRDTDCPTHPASRAPDRATGRPDRAPVGSLRLGLIIARTDQLSVGIARISVYPVGFEVDLFVVREDEDEDDRFPNAASAAQQPTRKIDPDPDKLLSFGVQFADGGRISIRTGHESHNRRGDLTIRYAPRAHGTGIRPSFWVQPLPPPGPLVFCCEWAAAEIPLTQHTIDAGAILNAARAGD